MSALRILIVSLLGVLLGCGGRDKAVRLIEGAAAIAAKPPMKTAKTAGLVEDGPEQTVESIDCEKLKKKIDAFVLDDENSGGVDQLPLAVNPEPSDEDDPALTSINAKHGARLAPVWTKIKKTVRRCKLLGDEGMSTTSALCFRVLARVGTDGAL